MPLVSIIMNCHNGSLYLSQALNSILEQSFKNWELIFWDNCSTDKSKNIVKSVKDKRIKYFYSKKFHNLAESRNLALSETNGDYIAFLDTDDIWLTDHLFNLYEFISKNSHNELVYSGTIVLKQNNKSKIHFYPLHNYSEIPERNFIDYTLLNRQIAFGSILISKKAIVSVQPIPKDLKHSIDDYIILNTIIKYPCAFNKRLTFLYRSHDMNLSNFQTIIAVHEALEVMNMIKLRFKNFKIDDLIFKDRYYKLSIHYLLKRKFILFAQYFYKCTLFFFIKMSIKTVYKRILRFKNKNSSNLEFIQIFKELENIKNEKINISN